MFASFSDLLRAQMGKGTALGAFTCYNFETAAAVLLAAQKRQCGVILLVSEKSFVSEYGAYLVAGLCALAEQASTPACLQLDHVSDLSSIEAAFQLGVGAVMADGSRLPFDENIAFTQQAIAIARRYGGYIEAELGHIEGNEDVASAARAGALTDPEQAAYFVEQTACSCLAVSIGNVHGTYRYPPVLDWARLQAIHRLTNAPLSLHGASGLTEDDLRQAMQSGIVKTNINTELRTRYLEVVADTLGEVVTGARLLDLQSAIMVAIEQTVDEKLRIYGNQAINSQTEAV